MSTFGRAPVRRDALGMIPSPSRQQASGIYPTGLPYDTRTRSVANPDDRTGHECAAAQAAPSPASSPHRSAAPAAPVTPVRTQATAPTRSVSASAAGELTAAVLQVINAATRLLESGVAATELRGALVQQFGARAVSKARAQLEELVPGYANLVASPAVARPAPARAAHPRTSSAGGQPGSVPKRRLGSVEPQDGAVNWNSTLRSDVWGDRMERYVGINPKQVSGQDWRSPRRPRSVMPPELPLGAAEGEEADAAGRTTLAERCSRAMPQPESSVFHPDGHRESTDAEVAADESRWGCNSAGAPNAKMLDVFGATSSVRRGQESPYADPEFATHRQWPSDLEPDRSKDKAKPAGIRARPVEVNQDEARKREVRMQYNTGGTSQRPRPKLSGKGGGGGGGSGKERGYSRDEYRYAMRRGAAERLSLVQRLKEMELELMVAKQRNTQQEQQLLRLASQQHQQAGSAEPHPSPSEPDSTPPGTLLQGVAASPILLDPRIRRSAESGHSRASLACEVERELLLLALAAEAQLTVEGGGSPQIAAVRGYAAMVLQLSDEFHAEMRHVQDVPCTQAAAGEKDLEAAIEEEVLRTYACVVLDFGERLKALRKRHASVRDRLTAAAVALHANARERDDRQLASAASADLGGGVGGMSVRVSMMRELQELSSIAVGSGGFGADQEETRASASAVNLTDASTASIADDRGGEELPLPSAIKAVAAEYSGREDAVMDGLAELSVSTVGDTTAAAADVTAAAAAAGGDASGRQSPRTWDDILATNDVESTPAAPATGVGSPSPFVSPPFGSPPFTTTDVGLETAAAAPAASLTAAAAGDGGPTLGGVDGTPDLVDDDEASREALARLTEKVATLSQINQQLEEQLQEEEVVEQELTPAAAAFASAAAGADSGDVGLFTCVFRAAVTELLDFDPQMPRITKNIEVDQHVQVVEIKTTQSGQARGRLREGGWVSMINRQGVVQFRKVTEPRE